jgi:predicted Rossmann fold flavoprotein
MLMAGIQQAQVRLGFNTRVATVTHDGLFHVTTEAGERFSTPSLVIASGGLSIPKLGASGFAYRIAQQFGVPIVTPEPALVPLTFDEPALTFMRDLSGTACNVVAETGKTRFREAMLFTHRGLSGPAILQISSYLRSGESISVDLLPGRDARETLLAAKRARPKVALRTALAEHLPQRLTQALAPDESGPPIGMMTDKTLAAMAERLQRWRLTPSGTEGFAKAEVTRGGIDARALSSQTMAVRNVAGLHFIGEAVDVTGWLGGYNFQWAWASGFAAGTAI